MGYKYIVLGVFAALVGLSGLFWLIKSNISPFYKISNPSQTNNQSKPFSSKVTKLEKEEGNVTVIVEYLPGRSDENSSTFLITLDTHSVDLDAFNFQKDVFLGKEGRGSLPIKVNQSGSGHHRKAEVTFKKVSLPFVIILSDLAGASKREFLFSNL